MPDFDHQILYFSKYIKRYDPINTGASSFQIHSDIYRILGRLLEITHSLICSGRPVRTTMSISESKVKLSLLRLIMSDLQRRDTPSQLAGLTGVRLIAGSDY